MPLLRRTLLGLLAALPVIVPVLAGAEPAVLAAGQSVDLGVVFWADGCTSTLLTIVGVDVLEAPAGVELSIRKEDVLARPGCTKIPGGVVVASVKSVSAPLTGTVRYRVRYRTLNGPRQSEHSAQLSLQP